MTTSIFNFNILVNYVGAFLWCIDGSVTATAVSDLSSILRPSIGNGTCTNGYFKCTNDSLCVSQKNNCDGKLDCPSGSDEIDCDDDDGDDFWDHFVRKRLSAEHDDDVKTCNLTYVDHEGLCVCRRKDLLCLHKNLDKVPDHLPLLEAVDLLDFHDNNFKILSPDSLRTLPREINKINLAHCKISRIVEKAFFGHGNIKYLHLDNNEIETIPANLFETGNILRTLSIMYNKVSTINPDAFKQLPNLLELDLRGNQIVRVHREVLAPLKKLSLLYLQNNQIKRVDSGAFPALPLIQLSLMMNEIETLDYGAFAMLPLLEDLFLSNNRLKRLINGTFHNLIKLRVLTLNDNSIRSIESGVFSDVTALNSLRLERNQFKMLDRNVLQSLKNLPYIYFDRFEMCSAAAHVRVCYPQGDGISSQKHLLDNLVLRASVWIMGTIGCIGNLIVLMGRFLAPTTNNNVVHSLYLRNLALSDLLMGIYLFSIATADSYYRGVYLTYQYVWRHSFMCNLCGFLSTLSCESSVLILSLVTWDRFVSVTQPLARKQPSPRTAALTLIVLWTFAAAVSLLPLANVTRTYFGDEFYGSNGVCLSLHIHDPYAMGWEYSAAMYILVNTMALIFICYAYTRMISEIKASGVACRSTRQSQERDRVAQRFGIIILTDCLCWVPVIVVKLVALSGYPIPQTLYAWLAIFILPINSALNPVLYTLTTTAFKKQMRKIANSCICKRRMRDEPHHNHQSAASESGFSLSFVVFPIGGSTRRLLSYRGTQSSTTNSKNSWKRAPTAVV